MTQLEYFKLSKFNRFLYKLGNFFKNLGLGFVKFWVKFGKAVAKGFLKFIGAFVLISVIVMFLPKAPLYIAR